MVGLACLLLLLLSRPDFSPPPTPYPHSNSVSLRDLPLLTFPLLWGRLILLPSLY